MDTILPDLYKDYGLYSNYRNFPYDLDGLKPVERRVLYSAYKIAKSWVKSRQVDAYTIGHFHPHGECYGTIVQLVRQGLMDGQGNFGSNVGVEPVGPAAPRYTECKINNTSLELAFKYINYVPIVDTELGDKEPQFLPVMFPLCLIGTDYTQGIGFGYKTMIPCYDIKDLYNRLLGLLKVTKEIPTIAPITDCEIISGDDELEKLLTTGRAKIEVSGVIEINHRSSTVVLRSWPPGRKFQSLLKKFSREFNENMIGYTDLSSSETNIVFQVLRERNRDKIFKEFVKKLEDALIGTISFEIVLINSNNNVIVKSVDDMLLDTYNMYCNVNETMIQSEIDRLSERIKEFIILDKIKQPLSQCLKDGKDITDTIDYIEKTTKFLKKDIESLFEKYNIKKLLTLNTDISDLQNKAEVFTKQSAEIDKFVLEQYNEKFA